MSTETEKKSEENENILKKQEGNEINFDMAVCFIDKSSALLGHDATSVSNCNQTFRGSVMPSSIAGDRSFAGVSLTYMLLTSVPQVLGVCGPLL